MKQNGGLISAKDFADYKIEIREPLVTTYRGFQVVGFPPPSSGGVHVAEALNILETFDLKAMEPGARLHVLAETMKLVFADRAYWLGDPAFARVPRGLTEKDYARTLAKNISLERTVEISTHGIPADWSQNYFKKHTTHFSTADDQGNWVACTATVNTSFGSKVVIPGTGIVLNNQMDDFSIAPGTTNYFGLIGAEANSVGPRKRPLSSMTPTIVLKDGKPIFALGAAGGPKIISQVIQELVGLLDLGMPVKEAIAQPRIHHQWFPDELIFEETLPVNLRDYLRMRGHKLQAGSGLGISQVVGFNAVSGQFLGAADPRGYGTAQGW
jgi:gamma-glutamyltranspeptidase/glutathione hydrolase